MKLYKPRAYNRNYTVLQLLLGNILGQVKQVLLNKLVNYRTIFFPVQEAGVFAKEQDFGVSVFL